MQLPEISIRRPVFATVLSLLIVLVGVVSFTRLNVREYPKIDNPVVTVETKYTGASSAVVESQVTKVLEDSLSGIEGVDVITSISRQEQSQITINFVLSRDADSAAADVRDKVSRVRQRLPQGIDEPVIAKVEAEAFPVIWLSFSADTLNVLQLTDYANRIAKPMLQTAPGASDVRVYGERKYAMRIWLDPDRLAAYKLTTQDVEDALRRELHEELGITIGHGPGAVQPWQQLVMDYPHARVRLHFCKVYDWSGTLEMREGQTHAWQALPLQVGPVLPGTVPVLAWLAAERGFEGATF